MNIKKIIDKTRNYYTGEWLMHESMRYSKRRRYTMTKTTRIQSFVIIYRRALQGKSLSKWKFLSKIK